MSEQGLAQLGQVLAHSLPEGQPVGALVGVFFIRNIGVFSEGLVFAVLVGNLIHPLLDKIRPKALGKVE